MTERQTGEGGRAFFLLAAVILGGLLFALGVMVGRATAPAGPMSDPDSLGKIDARDSHPLAVKDDDLEYPQALSGPPAQNPAGDEAKKIAAAVPPPNPRVEQAKPAQDKDAQPVAADAASYCLQVASFQKQDQAEQLVAKLKKRGLPHVRIVAGEVAGKGTYYRVRVGRFGERKKAEALNDRESLEGLIIQSEE